MFGWLLETPICLLTQFLFASGSKPKRQCSTQCLCGSNPTLGWLETNVLRVKSQNQNLLEKGMGETPKMKLL